MSGTIQPTFNCVASYLAGNSLMTNYNPNLSLVNFQFNNTKFKHIKQIAFDGTTIPEGKSLVSYLNRTDFFYGLFFYNHNVKTVKNNTKTLTYKNLIRYKYGVINETELPNNEIILGKLYHYDEKIATKYLKDGKIHFKIMGYSRKYGDLVISKTTSIYIHKLVNFCKEYNFSYEIIQNNKKQILSNYCPKTDCSICLEENNKRCVQLPCGHKFHKVCINTWFNNSKECPLCRTKVITEVQPQGYYANNF